MKAYLEEQEIGKAHARRAQHKAPVIAYEAKTKGKKGRGKTGTWKW